MAVSPMPGRPFNVITLKN